jgi:hypothetical protein
VLSSSTSLKASYNLHCNPQFSCLLHAAEVWTLISCLDYLYLCDIAIFIAIVLCAGEFNLYQFSCLLHAAEVWTLISCLDYLYLCDIAIFIAIVLCAGEFNLY